MRTKTWIVVLVALVGLGSLGPLGCEGDGSGWGVGGQGGLEDREDREHDPVPCSWDLDCPNTHYCQDFDRPEWAESEGICLRYECREMLPINRPGYRTCVPSVCDTPYEDDWHCIQRQCELTVDCQRNPGRWAVAD